VVDLFAERGVIVTHTTVMRWVQRYVPIFEKRWKKYAHPIGPSWRVDETYIKVKGKWAYYYRAIEKDGHTIDFYLSPTRNAKAAKRFPGKSIQGLSDWAFPRKLNTDKASAYTAAIQELKQEGKLPPETEHRQVKYLNNRIKSDHGKLKRLVKPTLGFKSMKTAYATLKGFEIMRALKKGQDSLWRYQPGIKGEVCLIHRNFGLYAS